ncbi:MAG: fibronectin type III domain-containing protein, partial [Saprospiraceae bacterium]|nr:fibronectin type III domain-containing protein [Saprospiraceae bacterium]
MKKILLSNLILWILSTPSFSKCDDIPSGLSVSQINSTSVTLLWSKTENAIKYEVEIEDTDNTPSFELDKNTSETSLLVTGLVPGGHYKFKVKSECSSGSSDHSPWFFFSTGTGDSGNGNDDSNSGSCAIPGGLDIAENNGSSVTRRWSAEGRSLQYEDDIEKEENTPALNIEA